MTHWSKEDLAAHIAKQEKKKTPKYRNQKTMADGVLFDSKKEATTWVMLKLREAAGEIENLKRQQDFPIVINGEKVCTYRADFTYTSAGYLFVLDAKGFRTREYKLKKKLMKAVLGIDIMEM